MNNSNILQEAFKQLELIEEDAEFPLDNKGAEEAQEYMSDSEALDALEVIDTEAETEEDLEESHIGDVILECSVCHSQTFMKPEEVTISEESDLANEGTECPYCYCTNGFKIIGQVAPYEEPPTVEIEPKETEEDEEDIENEEDVFEESFKKDCGKSKKLKESFGNKVVFIDISGSVEPEDAENCINHAKKNFGNNLDIYYFANNVSKNPDDVGYGTDTGNLVQFIRDKELSPEDVVIYTNDDINYGYDDVHDYSDTIIDMFNGYQLMSESLENIDIETEHDIIHVNSEDKIESDEEMLAPLEPEVKEEIEDEESEEDALEETPEKELPDDEYEDVDIEDFDEETFDNMGESYLKNVYENVDSFKSSSVKEKGNKWIVEGVIGFKSGKKKNTQFIFEALNTSNGVLTFNGSNKQISKGNKSFTLKGVVDCKKFFTESLRYNYKQKDANGKSVRVYGTVKRK